MMELTINGQVYQFNFGMGFLREINKKIGVPIQGTKDAKKNVGLQYAVAGIVDNDVEELVNVLNAANKGQTPRVTQQMLDDYIDQEDTDIDALFDEVLDFLKKTNATKKTTMDILKEVEKAEQKKGQ
ncbi:tail assembly chaperone [Anaerostipes butyraticus]|uniref:tail assembly chaperone n=1 Tax=Anaerostipes butyraticus TaxID=645466 RepID=UPI0023A85EE3|nr:tail assembly chaperone [Anaerostipes butyraticus]